MRRHLLALAVAGLLSFAAAAHAAPPVEDYGKLPAIDHVSLSPSGDRLALVATVNDSRRLFVKSTSGNELLLNLPLDGVRFIGAQWAGDDHLLLFTTITLGGGDNRSLNQVRRVSVIDLASHKGFDLFGKGGDVVNAVFGDVQPASMNNQWYAFAVGLPGGDCAACLGAPILYKINLDTGERTVAARGNDLTQEWFVAPSGEIVARREENRLGDWRVLAGKDGLSITSGHSKYAGGNIIGFGRTTSTLLIAEPVTDTSLTAKIEEWPLAGGGKPTERVLPDDPLWLINDRLGRVQIGQRVEGDQPTYTFFDPKLAARFNGAKAAFAGVNVRLESWSQDFNRLVVFTDGGDDSGTYWLVDISTGKASILGEEYPTVGSADVGKGKMIEYKASDGTTIHALLTLPPGSDGKALPLIVIPHRGPITRVRPGFDWLVQLFASRGYAVLQPNYRGSDGYGEAFIEAGFGEWGRKMQTDLSDGVSNLAAQGVVDPKRVCIVGSDYGGFAALAGVTLQHGVYRCAIAISAVADLTELLDYKRDRYGESPETANWDRFIGASLSKSTISPADHASAADAPILLFHGRNDEVFLASQSQEMDDRLRGAGKVSHLIIFPDESHTMLLGPTRITVAKESIDFVEKYNRSDAPK